LDKQGGGVRDEKSCHHLHFPGRDCHIRGDWLLVYRIVETKDGEEVIFIRTGTHAELFE